MLYQSIAYLKWLPKTFHLHGIHSPFVFMLEKKVLRGKSDITISKQLSKCRKELLQSKEIIEVTDYGSGSRVFKSNKREVSKIAKIAGATLKRTLLLQRLIAHFKPKETLELGTSLGLATAALSIDQTGRVTTIEGCPNTASIAEKHLKQSGINNVTLKIGDFKDEIKKLSNRTFDFIYFDGNHSKVATLNYVEQLLPSIHNETVWILDDIHWSREMTEAWEAIKKLPEVTVSIDCFWFGMIFFRVEQAKEDFYIKL